jgi:hypothetical protein
LKKQKKDTVEDIRSYLQSLRKAEQTGGAFNVKALKHGGTPRAIAAMAASQILDAMRERKVDVLTIRKTDLPELFGENALEEPKNGRAPTLKSYILTHLRARGVYVAYYKGLVDFFRKEPTKNPKI